MPDEIDDTGKRQRIGLMTAAGPLIDDVSPDDITGRMTLVGDDAVRAALVRLQTKIEDTVDQLAGAYESVRKRVHDLADAHHAHALVDTAKHKEVDAMAAQFAVTLSSLDLVRQRTHDLANDIAKVNADLREHKAVVLGPNGSDGRLHVIDAIVAGIKADTAAATAEAKASRRWVLGEAIAVIILVIAGWMAADRRLTQVETRQEQTIRTFDNYARRVDATFDRLLDRLDAVVDRLPGKQPDPVIIGP